MSKGSKASSGSKQSKDLPCREDDLYDLNPRTSGAAHVDPVDAEQVSEIDIDANL